MITTMKTKLMMLLLAFLTANAATAYDFEVGGIYYLIDGTEATVTSATPYYIITDKYTGDVVIPETVTFNGVTYPVTAIGNHAFYWCTELTSIRIPRSIKRVEGSMCFYHCSKLSVVDIESLESWCNIDFEVSPGYNFSYSNPLSYAHDLYLNGEKLTQVVIPEGVSKIGTSAFCKLSSMRRLEIPTSVTSIGDEAFSGCGAIDRLDIPDLESWMSIDIQGKGSNPMGFARKIYLDGTEMPSEFFIPETITTISANAFNGCLAITSVSIPSSVQTIGANAFAYCDSLEKVEIQDIAAWCNIAFENTMANPMSNGIHAHWYDEKETMVYVNGNLITQLEVPDGVTSIGNHAFAGATFGHVKFPGTLVTIGDGAFEYSWLDEVLFPENLSILGKSAFFNCESLKKVQINEGLEVIPELSFSNCINLSDVSMPSTVRKIESFAFEGCRSLTSLPMTDSLQVIEKGAFLQIGITHLKTGKSLTSIGDYAFANCYELTDVEIGNQVTTLGENIFSNSYLLKNVIVGNGVQTIPKGFCRDCTDLTTVSLGDAVDTIETLCFSGCLNLNSVICKAVVPPVMNGAEDSFFNSTVFQNAKLYIPYNSLEDYQTSYVWKKFQNILAFNIPGDINGDGEVNMGDANSVIDIVIMGGNNGHPRIPGHNDDGFGDVNGDGEVNIADVNTIIEMILSNK